MVPTPIALDAPVPSTEYARMMDTSNDEGLYEALRQVIDNGFTVIRNTPSVPGAVKTLAERIAPISHSFQYGDVFDVVAEPKPVNIAYTTVYLKSHVDLAYYESPPGFQFLHALRFDESVKGGESTFVDVFAVAEEFRRLHPEHFTTFCRVPATFKKHHLTREKATIMEYQRPHIQLNHRDEVVAVHWSPPFEGPLRVPFDDVMSYYNSYRVFHELVEGGKHRYEFRLKQGDTVIFNQRRVLHGRKQFTPCSDGVRHLQGTYINIDDALCRYNVLRTRFGADDPTAKNQRVANGNFSLQESDAAYDRLVVVLIDALRADMVLGSAAMHGSAENDRQQTKGELNAFMPFTSGLVASGRALGYVAHASVPTVTMPRLKALVTGKAPAFIDILKNFNSAALDEDANLVSLLAASGKRIVFYGDDTWLKLFPETFKRSDGTSGFFTRDTVEVDNNVTRHLKEELDPTMQNEKSGDWDALVLHYLGLDHVGHLRGPRSPLMRGKLQEMDGVVQLVVDSVGEQDARRMEKDTSARPSLILLCSDHGMSEVGNHGGATLEESSALLMFMRGDGKPMRSTEDISYKQKRSQVDLVPTISSLFGLPIPLYSSGLLLDDVVRASSGFALHSQSYYLRALYRNFQQLYALAKIKFHASTLKSFDKHYEKPLRKVSKILQGGEDTISVDKQTAAAVLQACETLQAQVAQSDGSEYNSTAIFSGLVFLFLGGVITLAMLITVVKAETKAGGVRRRSHLVTVLGVGSVLQIASLSSSSSIENEHATAFFMATSLLVAVGIVLLRRRKSSKRVSCSK
ncbi:hypothetical protein ON010_g16353 [Phytophthora cinnamomi]|nr:hypothetical protein ON010_g16353 [Phytophthora cinnamomi]